MEDGFDVEAHLDRIRALLEGHYEVEAPVAAGNLGDKQVASALAGPGEVVIAAVYAVDRFALWRARLQARGAWQAAQAQADEALERCMRVREADCLAEVPEGDPEGLCSSGIDPAEAERECHIWKSISPGVEPECCAADALDVAVFSGRLDAAGCLDPETLRLDGVKTVGIDGCNPGARRVAIDDFDRDGSLEVLAQYMSDEHALYECTNRPFDVLVLGLDLAVGHRHSLGCVWQGEDEGSAPREQWFWFEDRSGDDHPDVVVEEFEWDEDCVSPSEESWRREVPSPEGGSGEDEGLADETDCERRNRETKVYVYDTGKDVWAEEDPG
ncbi:MAG: hypothetical protein JXB32_00695 [Deltaproteobacteria bacterium]|nr:hypothetical protein [Deltaproteobacteria bacterium]